MQFMVIERFRDPHAVYRRLRDEGRGTPEGVAVVASWVEASLGRCFQVMECGDVGLLQQWTARWSDLIDFEIVPVAPAAETREAMAPLL